MSVFQARQTLLLIAAMAMFAWHGGVNAETRNYSVVLVGSDAGSQVVDTLEDGALRVTYSYNDRGRGPDTVTEIHLDESGIPSHITITGVDYMKAAVAESFERVGERSSWTSVADSGSANSRGFYLPLDGPPATLALLARVLLADDDGQIDLLPSGFARIEKVAKLTFSDQRTVQHVELHGLGFEPLPLWLNEDGSFFGMVDPWSSTIEEGSEGMIEDLIKRQDARRAERFKVMTRNARIAGDEPVLIDNARIIDVRNGRVRSENAVLVDNGSIVTLLSPDDPRPSASSVTAVNAQGRTLLPGLWDMHTHLDQMSGPLNIANGVTSVRDLANQPDSLNRIIAEIGNGTLIGPTVHRAGIIDGTGEFSGPTQAKVETEEDANKWVDFYADNGYSQIKIYSSVPVPLVEGMAQRAHDRDMRVSGHIPAGMWAEDAVRAGFDEIQHINMVFLNFYKDVTETRNPDRFIKVAERGADLDVNGPDFKAFVELLKTNNVVVDPTVAIFFDMFTHVPGEPKPTEKAIHERLPAQIARGSLKGGLEIPEGQEKRYAASADMMLSVIKALYDAGVTLVAGTDALPGFALHSEMELYVSAGIPAMDVLRLATLGAAEVVGSDGALGAIEPGMRADLILIDGKPDQRISNIRNVDWVMRGGTMYDPRKILDAVGVKPRM